jgi:thioredoxin-related protein
MVRLLQGALVALFFAFPPFVGHAAHEIATAISKQSRVEILVVEADGCIYCDAFRRDVLPAYLASERAKRVSMRFADIHAVETSDLSVAEPIGIVPTALVLKDNREIGRVSGYVGSSNFLPMIGALLSRAE